MAVYVDDNRLPARVGRVFARWSHMTASTEAELHAFALALGMKRSWFQPTTYYPDAPHNRERGRVGLPKNRFHYDVTDAVRLRAIAAGAVPVRVRSPEWRAAFLAHRTKVSPS